MNIHLYLIIFSIILFAGCTSNKKQSDNKGTANNEKPAIEQKFSSDEYSFSVNSPPDWKLEVSEIGNNLAIINIYPVSTADSIDFPLAIHENSGLSYVSIFPNGYGTELPSGKSGNLPGTEEELFSFDINVNESLAFFLDNNQAWGYFIVPSSTPSNWSPHGFIFAKAAVNNFSIRCFDKETGKELEMAECNPLLGDSITRYGEVVQEDMQAINSILQSIKLKDISNNEQSDSGSDTNEIIITKPQPHSEIYSPLEITGKARGSWFFEAVIEIELLKAGKTLARTFGKAKGNWMTDDYVDFSATLKFSEVTETGKAELRFSNSNPSGKKELKKSFKVPVVIGE